MKIVVDHVSGSRRGQRQELNELDRVSFGRHPGCTVSFDAHRDLDVSSRHAELRIEDRVATLVDIGSSNGTFVGGVEVIERRIEPGSPVVVEFGSGGPQISLWVGGENDLVPSATLRASSRLPMVLWLAFAVLAVVVGIVLAQVFT